MCDALEDHDGLADALTEGPDIGARLSGKGSESGTILP